MMADASPSRFETQLFYLSWKKSSSGVLVRRLCLQCNCNNKLVLSARAHSWEAVWNVMQNLSVYFNTYVFTSSWSHHWASRSRGWGDRTLPSDLALAGAAFKWGSSVGNIVYLFGEGVKGVKLLALEYKTISSRIYYPFRRNHRPYFLTHSPFFNNSLFWTTGSDHLDCPYFYNSLFWSTWFAYLD